ncbi:MAG: GspH/FimT family pseudopilin [Pseudomonadota bacterium]
MHIKNFRGISFIEIMIVLVIVAIISTHAWSAWTHTTALYERNQTVHTIESLIRDTRLNARYSGKNWNFCLANGQACQINGKNWIVFEDANQNGMLDAGEKHKSWPNERPVLIQVQGNLLNPSADFAAFTGTIWPGSIQVCHHNLSGSSRVIVSRMGRARVVRENVSC